MRIHWFFLLLSLRRISTNDFTSDEWLILLFFVKLPIGGAKRIERDASVALLN